MVRGQTFATWLQRHLLRREWTQADFARRLNVSPQVVSKWILAQRIPDPASCDRIADVLGVDLDLVLWQAGHRPNVERIDPDDPRTVLGALINAIDWSQGDRFHFLEGILTMWRNEDYGRRKQ